MLLTCIRVVHLRDGWVGQAGSGRCIMARRGFLVPAGARLLLTVFCLVARVGPRGAGQVLWAGKTRTSAAHAAVSWLVIACQCLSWQEEEAQTRPCRRRWRLSRNLLDHPSSNLWAVPILSLHVGAGVRRRLAGQDLLWSHFCLAQSRPYT